jgi:hypothetical protein
MEAEVERVRVLLRSYPETPVRSACIQAHFYAYHDQLLRDMGQSPHRFGGVFGGVANVIVPLEPAQLEECVKPRGERPWQASSAAAVHPGCGVGRGGGHAAARGAHAAEAMRGKALRHGDVQMAA